MTPPENTSEAETTQNEYEYVTNLPINHTVHPALKMPETLGCIFSHLKVKDRGQAAMVCVDWWDAFLQPSVWHNDVFHAYPDRPIPLPILERRHPIRRFVIQHSDDEFLVRGALRTLCAHASDARSLVFNHCGISIEDILRNTFPPLGLPRLTELGFISSSGLNDWGVEFFSRKMPNLLSLELDTCAWISDDALLLIAVRLRKLRRLSIRNCCQLTTEGFKYLSGKINRKDVAAVIRRLSVRRELEGVFEDARVADLQVVNLAGRRCPSIVGLNFCDQELMDSTLLQVSEMTELTQLHVVECELVSATGLDDCLAKLTNLRMLHLIKCPAVTETGLANFDKMVNLQVLNMFCCSALTDAGLAHVAKVRGLKHLWLRGCPSITSMGLHHLARHRSGVTSLDVRNCDRVGADALFVIAEGLFRLRRLYLDHVHVTREGFRLAVANLSDLEDFEITEETPIVNPC